MDDKSVTVYLTAAVVGFVYLLFKVIRQHWLLNKLDLYCLQVDRSSWPRALSSKFDSWRFQSVIQILEWKGEIDWTIPQQLIDQVTLVKDKQRTLTKTLEDLSKSESGDRPFLIAYLLDMTASIDVVCKEHELLFKIVKEPHLSLRDFPDLKESEREQLLSVGEVIESMHVWYCKNLYLEHAD